MNKEEQEQVFDKLFKTIEYITTEYDIQYHELIGMLEQVKYDIQMNYFIESRNYLCNKCKDNKSEFDDHDEDDHDEDDNDELIDVDLPPDND